MSQRSVAAHFRRRIAVASGNRQALVDLHLEAQLELGLDREQEHELQDEIERRLHSLGGWQDALPSGLQVCPYCEKVRDGRPGGTRSACLCAGITCRYCGAGRIHRPISDHYELDDHRLWHTPYFGQRIGCRWCAELRRRLAPGTEDCWGAETETPAVATISESLRTAARALGSAQHRVGDALPRHDLVAVHGDVEEWHALRLGPRPDSRPLYVGRSLEELDVRRIAPNLRVATWRASRGQPALEQTLRELLIRWQPPLNEDVDTPWNKATR